MENLRTELSFLEHVESRTKNSDTTEYYIRLREVNGHFRCISDNSTLLQTARNKYPWHIGEPAGNEECVKMWRRRGTSYFFDDVPCTDDKPTGYICESSLECKYKNGKSSKKQQLEKYGRFFVSTVCWVISLFQL